MWMCLWNNSSSVNELAHIANPVWFFFWVKFDCMHLYQPLTIYNFSQVLIFLIYQGCKVVFLALPLQINFSLTHLWDCLQLFLWVQILFYICKCVYVYLFMCMYVWSIFSFFFADCSYVTHGFWACSLLDHGEKDVFKVLNMTNGGKLQYIWLETVIFLRTKVFVLCKFVSYCVQKSFAVNTMQMECSL